MKKIAYSLAIILAAVSCAKEEMPSPAEAGNGLKKLTFAGCHEASDTKAVIADGNVCWFPSDSISVFELGSSYSGGYKFVSQNDTASTSVASFLGEAPESADGYYALCPYSNLAGGSYGFVDDDQDGVAETIRLPWRGMAQNFRWGSFDPSKGYMVGKTAVDESGKLTCNFYHVFAYIKFTIDFPCTSLRFSANNDEIIATGDVDIKVGSDGIPTVKGSYKVDAERSSSILLYNLSSTDLQTGTYYIPLLPGTLEKGFTVTINGSPFTESTLTKTTSKQVTLQRGHVLNIGEIKIEDYSSTTEIKGSGTEEDPFLIWNLDQMYLFANKINNGQDKDKYYVLAQDIDCGGKTLSAIGSTSKNAFTGTFDGKGHTISNFNPGVGDKCVALFGYVRNATIKDVNLSLNGLPMPASAATYYSDGFSVSPFIGFSNADEGKYTTITGCSSVNTMTIPTAYSGKAKPNIQVEFKRLNYGGVVGHSVGNLRIEKCSAAGDIFIWGSYDGENKYRYALGGMVGMAEANTKKNDYLIIDRCKNTTSLIAFNDSDIHIGGIVGYDYDGWTCDIITRITNCMNTGRLIANSTDFGDSIYCEENSCVGGIIGDHDSDGESGYGTPYIYNCLNTGYIYSHNGDIWVGGTIGYCYDEDTEIFSCANTASVEGNYQGSWPYTNEIGGIGGHDDGVYNNCFWTCARNLNCDSSYKYQNNCSRKDIITGDTMNGTLAALPESKDGFTYCSWTGTSEDGSLTLVY